MQGSLFTQQSRISNVFYYRNPFAIIKIEDWNMLIYLLCLCMQVHCSVKHKHYKAVNLALDKISCDIDHSVTLDLTASSILV